MNRVLRATASKYRESADSKENSDFLFLRQKDPFGKLFSEIYFQSSSEFTFLWNLGKFKIQLNQPRWSMEFIQNCTFSTRQYGKMGTCLGFIFTQFVIYSLVILLSQKYEVRSKTKLAFRVVESLFRFVSLCTQFVSSTSQIISSGIGSIRLIADEFVSSTPQIVSSPTSSSCRDQTCRHRVRLIDSWDRLITHHSP